jgi:hypothetical protein
MQAETDSDEVYAQIMLQPEADVSRLIYSFLLDHNPLILPLSLFLCSYNIKYCSSHYDISILPTVYLFNGYYDMFAF